MKEKTPKYLLRRSYMDILRGFTKTKVDKFGEFYFKHLDLFASEEIDERKREYEEYAVNQGLPTEEEKIKELIKDELWSAEKDKEIEDLESLISSLKETKAKFYLKRDIDNIQRQVDEETEKLQTLQTQRIELVGFTTDSYSTKKINEFFIFNTSFKDRDLTEKFFEKDQYDELHEDDIMLLILNYNKVSQLFNEDNIKRIALSGFFLNSFYLCKDNPFTFYGKPVVDLTFNQNELFNFGRYFKHVLSELKHEPSKEVMEDPEKLIELFNVSKNSEKIKQKMSDSDATTIVGATQEDLERMGITSPKQDGAVSLSKAAAEHGGSLNMEQLMKLHGV